MMLENCSIDDNFLPFNDNTKITFGGENQVQKLIKFYLSDKGQENEENEKDEENEENKKNAKRFKINCIVGENGTGKSRLFEKIINHYGEKYNILLDDFFSLGNLFSSEKNVNKGIFIAVKFKKIQSLPINYS